MGFLGLGKNKTPKQVTPAPADDKPAAEQGTQRKSRRIVAPGQKPGNTGQSVSRMPPKPQTQTVNRQTQRPPEIQSSSSSGRVESKRPIVESRPPEFSGDLGSLGNAGSAHGGVCRTGDNALCEFLISKAKLLDQGQVAQLRSKAEAESLPLDQAAVVAGLLTEEQLVNALTQECWVPHLKVDKYEIRKKALDTIAREDAEHYGVFPVDKLGSLLTMAMVNPLDAETIRVLEAKTGLDIKKVVATRSEINQGIAKYYGGLVAAKEGSINITQDVEPKSVTQMLANVNVNDRSATPMSRSAEANISAEIQDIDDLLASDERIAPSIIEPVSLSATEIEPLSDESSVDLPMVTPAQGSPLLSPSFSLDDGLPELVAAAPAAPAAPVAPEFEFDDAPVVAPVAKPAAPAPIAPEFEFDAPQIDPPTLSRPAAPAKPVASATSAAPAAPAAPLIPVRPAPAAPAAARPAAPVAKAAPAPAAPAAPRTTAKPATSRFTNRTTQPNVLNLIPVMEEEFQHAITHGKSHVFDKWVGLQTRNRIINATVVENEVWKLLEGLTPRQAG